MFVCVFSFFLLFYIYNFFYFTSNELFRFWCCANVCIIAEMPFSCCPTWRSSRRKSVLCRFSRTNSALSSRNMLLVKVNLILSFSYHRLLFRATSAYQKTQLWFCLCGHYWKGSFIFSFYRLLLLFRETCWSTRYSNKINYNKSDCSLSMKWDFFTLALKPFIFLQMHMIGDRSRGATIEHILIKYRYKTKGLLFRSFILMICSSLFPSQYPRRLWYFANNFSVFPLYLMKSH